MALAARDAASATLTPPAAARLSAAEAAPPMMSATATPPLASSPMPSAASLAENAVLAPRSSARSRSCPSSSTLAPVTAPTALIVFSKSAAVVVA
jgi:hypothetical protein